LVLLNGYVLIANVHVYICAFAHLIGGLADLYQF